MAAGLVLDNSVVMAWCFENQSDGYPGAVLENLEHHEAVVPSVWPLEVGNVLLVAERRNRLARADSVRFLALLTTLPIVVEQEHPQRMFTEIFALAREHHLTTHDASYLDLAMRLGLPLATQDPQLSKAAEQCGVPVFTPEKPIDAK